MPVSPVIKYETTVLPLNDQFNLSIVRKRTDVDYINWANKTELTDFVDSLYVPPKSDTYMYIICQCGAEYIYVTKDDVPDTNVVCSCGRNVLIYGS